MAPEMFVSFFCHWYASGAVPAATTENVAMSPTVTAWFAGCVVMEGATACVPPPEVWLEEQPASRHASRAQQRMLAKGTFIAISRARGSKVLRRVGKQGQKSKKRWCQRIIKAQV